MKLIRPTRLQPGDLVGVVAASGPVDRSRLEAGLKVLGDRYRLRLDENALLARNGFLAGEDAPRLEALNAAIRDPELRAIIMARGGYGLTRILPGIDREALRANPKLIVGYSDVTALLALCAQTGVAAIHGPMVSELASLETEDMTRLLDLLENPDPGALLTGLEPMVGGSAEGPLLGGNLEVLSRLLGTPFEPDLQGTVLFLEDVGERPYRVDRALTHLEIAGALSGVAGIVIGDFTDCDDLTNGEVQPPTIRQVLAERLERLGVPVALGGRFGHGERKMSLPYGVPVRLDADAGSLVAIEGAVS
jgi:muramoyltetrapeptide carboxypeptidase